MLGKRVFRAAAVLILAAALAFLAFARYPMGYAAYIDRYSRAYGVPPALVCAVVNAESRFRGEARSGKGAGGLMQIMPGTAAWGAAELGLADGWDVHDAETNIRLGCWYLDKLYGQFGDWPTALAAYNAGSGNVSKWIARGDGGTEDIPFPETRRYVKRVLFDEKVYEWVWKIASRGLS